MKKYTLSSRFVYTFLLILSLSFVNVPKVFAFVDPNDPTITLGASSGSRGDVVSITGDHFHPNDTIFVTINGHVGNISTSTITVSNANSFSSGSTITIPNNATIGNNTVTASDSHGHSSSKSFFVNKLIPTLSVTNSPVTYDGTGHHPTVSASVAGTVSNVLVGGIASKTTAGTYAVTANFIPTDTTNYSSLTNASAGNFVINKANATIVVTPYSVNYDGASHVATGTATGVSNANLNASLNLSGTAHTNAGTYSTDAWTFSGGTNYNDASGTVTDSINKVDPTIVVTGYTGVYDGNSHGAFSGSATGVLGESLSGLNLGGTFKNVPGGTANWTYTDATGNYNNKNGTASVLISAAPVAVTADAKGKNFNDTDPTLTYSITSGSLFSSDGFSGSINRDPGEDVGTYAINQGSLSLGTNYSLTFIPANFTISANTINVTAETKTKVYGSADPELTYNFSPALKDGDSFSGSLTRSSGENVGSYGISQGTLSLGSNYNLSFTGNNFSITPALLTVTVLPQTKTYGDADPVLTYTHDALFGDDTLSGSLSRGVGENVGTYAINQGTLDNDNYLINFVSDNLTINKKDITVTADAQTKVAGSLDPVLTYTHDALVGDDSFEGALSRDEGEAPGIYPITLGTLTLSDNYNLNYAGANLTITTPPITGPQGSGSLTTPPPANTPPSNPPSGNNNGSGNGPTTNGNVGVGTTTPSTENTGTPEVLGAEKFIFTKYMKLGSKGNEITELQKRLTAEGFYKGVIDGVFGKDTDLAVRAYQKANPPLRIDGIVGPKTRAVLNK